MEDYKHTQDEVPCSSQLILPVDWQHWKHFLRVTGQVWEVETGDEEASEWVSAPYPQLHPLLLEARMTC